MDSKISSNSKECNNKNIKRALSRKNNKWRKNDFKSQLNYSPILLLKTIKIFIVSPP